VRVQNTALCEACYQHPHAQKRAKNVHIHEDVYRKQEKIDMTLTEYFSTEPRGAKLEMAEHLGITPTWLFLIMTGRKRPSPLLCVKIEEATEGLITKKELRPDLFS
jgi:hypothetical protein